MLFFYLTNMKIKIYWSEANTHELNNRVQICLDELGLVDFIHVEVTQDEALKTELGIEKEPALIIEEEAIDFKDTIFEGIIPENEELKSMFISIIGGSEGGGWCGSGEGWCPSGCSC